MTSQAAVPAHERVPAAGSAGPWLTLLATAGGLFLAVMSTTVISVALPSIGADLGAGATEQQWIVDAYVLVYASLLVTGGTLGDRWGRKGAFIGGVAAFGLGSLLAGLAPTVPVLLAGRVIQGLGPAFLVPGSLTLIRLAFPDERRRATAIGLWSTSSGLALAIGPVLGGVIVTGLGWRWVLLMNGPLSAALVVLAARVIPRPARATARHRFDLLGALLTTAGLAAVAFGLIEGQRLGWASPVIIGSFATGITILIVFVVWERHRAEPLIDVSLFLRPAFTAANVAGLVVFFAFIGLIVYLSAYFQQVHGDPADTAGIDVAAIGVAFALAAPVSGRLVGRYGALPPMLSGLALGGVAVLGLLRLGTGTGIGAIWWDLALGGFGIGMCLTPMTVTALSAAGTTRAGMASAVHNAMRQLGQVLGVAVLGALVYARLPRHGSGGRLSAADRALFVDGLRHAVWTAGLALLATGVLVCLLLLPSPRRTASGRR
ncbi:MFS transporter [Actinoallomurus soli]|uniref:MFS transporter n=1 Tax=Actinoallomurus soli TaxID=2952535 RepID=UPI002093B8C1|nr:MFS transporter [Actinoallomurus soli]MCO5968371.1 MFS transporter [Actinoallomurus soli]